MTLKVFAFRIIQRIGTVLIVVAMIGVIVEPSARPGLGEIAKIAAIALGAGAVTGLALKYFVPREGRLRAMHSMSPRLARWLLPPPVTRPESDDAK